jgi:hypothetical protein
VNSGGMGFFKPSVLKLLLANFLYFFPKLLAPFAINSFLKHYWYNDISDIFITFMIDKDMRLPTSLIETALYQISILLFNILVTYLLACTLVLLSNKLKKMVADK